eukprot:366149-Chlamydomonas_euryale.AAC.5
MSTPVPPPAPPYLERGMPTPIPTPPAPHLERGVAVHQHDLDGDGEAAPHRCVHTPKGSHPEHRPQEGLHVARKINVQVDLQMEGGKGGSFLSGRTTDPTDAEGGCPGCILA